MKVKNLIVVKAKWRSKKEGNYFVECTQGKFYGFGGYDPDVRRGQVHILSPCSEKVSCNNATQIAI